MLSLLHGFGTWYYGRKHVVKRAGTCARCHYEGNLSSFDTNSYFVVFLIPIVPLGRVRVIDQCPICSKHKAIKQDELTAIENRMVAAKLRLASQPDDAEAAGGFLQACLALRDVPRLLESLPALEASFSANPQVLVQMGTVLTLVGELAAAERILRPLSAASDDLGAREALGGLLLEAGRPMEALPHLQHLIEKPGDKQLPLVLQLGTAFQKTGDHLQALGMFEICRQLEPAMATDKAFITLESNSRRLRETNKPVNAARVIRRTRTRAALTRIVLMFISVCAIALIWSFVVSQHTPVYLVNGLNRKYTAKIDGIAYELSPFEVRLLKLHEGSVQIETPDLPAVTPRTLQIRSGFFSRIFGDTRFVINPDAAALLEKHNCGSGLPALPLESGAFSLSTGDALTSFDDVVVWFPASSMEWRAENRKRDRAYVRLMAVHVGEEYAPHLVYQAILGHLSEEDALSYFKVHASLEVDPHPYLAELEEQLPAVQFNEFARQLQQR